MRARRLGAWFLSAFCLAIAFVLALPVGVAGLLLIAGWVDGVPPSDVPGIGVCLVFIGGVIGVGVLVVVSVALVAGDPFVSLLRGWRSVRTRMRTLLAAVAAFALCLGLLVFADRSRKAYHAARAHEEQATAYRRLQGIDSRGGDVFDPKIWSPTRLEYFRAMECYHDDLRRKYDAAAYRPWLGVSPDPPEPTEPDGIPGDLDWLWRIMQAFMQIH